MKYFSKTSLMLCVALSFIACKKQAASDTATTTSGTTATAGGKAPIVLMAGDSCVVDTIGYRLIKAEYIPEDAPVFRGDIRHDTTIRWLSVTVQATNRTGHPKNEYGGSLFVFRSKDTLKQMNYLHRDEWNSDKMAIDQSGQFTDVYKVPLNVTEDMFWAPNQSDLSPSIDSVRYKLAVAKP
jgi:hypothetical protein